MAAKVQYDASFTADTTTAEQNVKRYAEQIRQANSTLLQAEKTARQSYGEQTIAAKAAGASTEQLQRITQEFNQKLYAIGMTAKESGKLLVEANRGAISSEDAKAEAVKLVNTQLSAQIDIVNALAAANAHGAHEAVSGVQATSAAIRGLEGSGGIRAIENFISKTLGLGPAMQAIFPIIGAGMFLKMLFDVGEKVYEVEQKAVHAAESTTAAYDAQHTKAQIAIDDLIVQADKLQDNIDKISGHPGNGLQTALDEARRYADKLLEVLKSDNKELQELFKQNTVTTLGGMLAGVASTAGQEKELLADRVGLTKKFADINRVYNAELSNAKSTDAVKAAGERRDQAIRNATQTTIDTYKKEGQRLQQEQQHSTDLTARLERAGLHLGGLFGTNKNNDAKQANIDADAGQLQDLLNTQTAQKRVTDLTEKDEAAKQAKELAEARKRGSKTASEAAKKASEEQRKRWDQDAREAEEGGKLTAQAELNAWMARANSVKIGSENWRYANEKAADQLRKINDDQKKQVEEARKMQEQFAAVQTKHIAGVMSGAVAGDAKGVVDQQTTLKTLLDAQRESTYQQGLAQAQQDAALGTISKYDEAVRIQTLHTAEYTDQLRELQLQLAAVDGASSEATAKRNTLQKQINDVSSKQQIESMHDTAAVAAQTWQGALINANAAWVQDSQNSAKQVVDLYHSALSGLNGSLVSVMTGGRGNFGSMFGGIGKQLMNVGLQKVEGGILGKLGLGKADGSRSNPLYVKNADVGSAGSSLMSGSSIGGGAASFLSSALSFLPGGSLIGGLFGGGRAVGGGVNAGTTYLMGEEGPELVTMGGQAHVSTAAQTRNMLASQAVQIHVHAQGATDPAQVRFQARMGAMEGHAAMAKMHGDQQADAKRRTPASRG